MNASRLLLVASLTSCASALMAFRLLSGRSLGIKVAQQRIRGGAVPMMSTAAPVAASTTVTNPLLDSSRIPQFRSISAADVVPAVSSVLANLEADVAKLEETLEAKVRNSSVRRNKIGPRSLRRSDHVVLNLRHYANLYSNYQKDVETRQQYFSKHSFEHILSSKPKHFFAFVRYDFHFGNRETKPATRTCSKTWSASKIP